MAEMNINPLTMDNIYQGRAVVVEVLNAGTPQERERHLGNVTVAENEMSADSTPVYSSNLPTRAKIGSLSNETGMNFNFTTQSITDDVKAWGSLGLKAGYTMAAEPDFEKDIGTVMRGDRIPLGRPVNDVAIAGLIAGEDFEMLEKNTVVLIRNKPVGTSGDLTVTGTAPAITGGTSIDIGLSTQTPIHVRVYGVELGKRSTIMDMPMGIIRPSSAMGWIGENDPVEAEFTVEVQADARGSYGTIVNY